MNVPLGLFLCVVISLQEHACSFSNQRETHLSHKANEVRGKSYDTKRLPRSTIGIWPAVIRALLQGAKEVPTRSTKYRKYIKEGATRKAYKDYLSLKLAYSGRNRKDIQPVEAHPLHATRQEGSSRKGPVRSSHKPEENHLRSEANEVEGRVSETRRWSRSTFGIWSAAIRALLRDAKQVSTKSRKHRKYVKQGTIHVALKDYSLLKLATGRGKLFSFEDIAGDLTVQLKTTDQLQRGKPSILVSNPNSGTSIEIVYKK